MKDAIEMMESKMPPDAVKSAHQKAEQDILSVKQSRKEGNLQPEEITRMTKEENLKQQR